MRLLIKKKKQGIVNTFHIHKFELIFFLVNLNFHCLHNQTKEVHSNKIEFKKWFNYFKLIIKYVFTSVVNVT